MKLGYAIACHGYEDRNLIIELLKSISLSTVLPDEVSISFSGVDNVDNINKDEFDFPIIISHTTDDNPAGKNFNIAALNLNTDLITFFGADDLVHPQRNEILLESFKNNEVKVLVHDFYLWNGGLPGLEMVRGLVYNSEYSHGPCRKGTFWSSIKENKLHINYHNSFVNEQVSPQNSTQHLDYANGHLTLRKEIFHEKQYKEVSRNEDTLYNIDLMKRGYIMSHLDNPLMIYRPNL